MQIFGENPNFGVNTLLHGMELQEKRITKSLKQTGNLLKKNIQLKDLC